MKDTWSDRKSANPPSNAMAPGDLLQLPISRHLLGRAFTQQVMEDAGEAGQTGAAVRHVRKQKKATGGCDVMLFHY